MDELSSLTLIRAREQGRALLDCVREAMVEVDQPGRLALVALFANGHLLIEDVPGVGKTTLARIIARAIGGHDARVQCTADLGPADVMGRTIMSADPALRPDTFDPGPIFANALVMDEINRATPRLQSAMFEALEERYVTVGKTRHALPRPFFVVATMNPYEGEGEMFRLPHGSVTASPSAPASATRPRRARSTCSTASATPTSWPTSIRSWHPATWCGCSAAPP